MVDILTYLSLVSGVLVSVLVLVAEDDRAVRESLSRALTLEGYEVTTVTNGAQALESIRERPADLLLLDVSMPVLDGLTACRVLRSEQNRVPIIMLTARTETSDRVAGLDAGADDYLAKPFELDELFARMLASLVNEIVAAASGDTADEPVERFDLAEVVAEVADRFERRTGRVISVDAVASPVDAQRAWVQRAVSCLVDNAAKFDPSGQPIEITVGDGAVKVMDRGPGIDPNELDRVFERFHRSESARALPGSGLGLSIVRDVAQRHGGATDASNRPDGEPRSDSGSDRDRSHRALT